MTDQIKHRAVERLREDSLEMLSMPHVRRRLGEYAVPLSEAVERSTFARVDDDGFIDLDGLRPESIPVVPRYAGEGSAALHARDSGMIIDQVRSMARFMSGEKAYTAAEKTYAHFVSNSQHRELPEFGKDNAAVTSANYWIPELGKIASGRPFISVNMDSAVDGRLSPVVFMHEMTHILQRLESPIEDVMQLARNKIRHELEAYYVSTQVVLGFKDVGRQQELLAHTTRDMVDRTRLIESVRAQYQEGDDNFDPNNKVVKGLVDHKLGITTELGSIIREQDSK